MNLRLRAASWVESKGSAFFLLGLLVLLQVIALGTEIGVAGDKSLGFFQTIRMGCAAGSLLALGILLNLNRIYRQKIKRTSDYFVLLAQGHLKAPLEDPVSDAFGQMVAQIKSFTFWFSEAIEKLLVNSKELERRSIAQEKGYKVLTHGSSQMLTKADDSRFMMDEVSSIADQVRESIEKMNGDISKICATADETSSSTSNIQNIVQEIDQFSQELNNVSQNSADVMGRAKETGLAAEKKINQLSESMVAIGKVTGVLKRIAARTNLLALNATIEAATAGEVGKGFAVVANEIKVLAQQSTHEAERIEEQILALEANAKGASEAIYQISGVVDDLIKSSNEMEGLISKESGLLSSIRSSVNGSVDASREMATSIYYLDEEAGKMLEKTEKMANNAHQVAMNIQDVSRHSRKSSSDLKRAIEATKQMNQSIRVLKRRFLIFQIKS